MNIWVPYTRVGCWTADCLLDHPNANYALMDDGDGYPKFLAERWKEGRQFINVEHDIVFHRSALKELWDCKHPWCAFAYREDEIFSENNHTPPLGCCKFSPWFMRKTAGVWETMLAAPQDRALNPTGMDLRGNAKWKMCDGWLRSWATYVILPDQIQVHQHFPAVENLRG